MEGSPAIPAKPKEPVQSLVEPKPGTTPVGGVSLSSYEDLARTDSSPEVKQVAPKKATPKPTIRRHAFEEAWETVIKEQIALDKSLLSAVLKSAKVEFDDEGGVMVCVHSSVNKELLEKDAEQIALRIGELLEIQAFELTVRVDADQVDDSPVKPYTAKDRYEAMVKSNPAMQSLMHKLKLKIEY